MKRTHDDTVVVYSSPERRPAKVARTGGCLADLLNPAPDSSVTAAATLLTLHVPIPTPAVLLAITEAAIAEGMRTPPPVPQFTPSKAFISSWTLSTWAWSSPSSRSIASRACSR